MAPSSRSRPSASTDHTPRTPSAPPTYQPPAQPLNNQAQRTLQNVSRTNDLARLKFHLDAASTTLSNTAAEINDRYHQRCEKQRRRRAKREQHGLEETEEDQQRDEKCEEMRSQVEGMTGVMEEGVRAVIDAQAHVEAVEAALGEVHGNVVAGGGMVAPTQSTLGASQFRQRRRGVESDSEEEGEEGQENVGPVGLLKKKLDEHDAQYGSLSLRNRQVCPLKQRALYAQHNSYVHFKRLVHDATHPGPDAPPVPNAATWFPADPREAHHPAQQQAQHVAADEDEESDVEVASERYEVSAQLREGGDLGYDIAEHCFRRRHGEARRNGAGEGDEVPGVRGGELLDLYISHDWGFSVAYAVAQSLTSAISDLYTDFPNYNSPSYPPFTPDRNPPPFFLKLKTPTPKDPQLTTLPQMLTASDLQPNIILARQIKRIQAAQAQEQDDDLDDSVLSRPQRTPGGRQRRTGDEVEVGSEDEDEETGMRRSVAPRIKSEVAATQEGGRGEERGRPSSSMGAIVDLGDEDEVEEETGDEDSYSDEMED
ncbi:hypothetical protein MMC13_006468 [Lambiella insularis]|nr:hypothetical protein [Lambiella insularis]